MQTQATSLIQTILDIPVMQTTLLQDGFKSTFFLNNTGVSLMLLQPLPD